MDRELIDLDKTNIELNINRILDHVYFGLYRCCLQSLLLEIVILEGTTLILSDEP